MNPIQFEGSVEIGKPANMTDEECFSVFAEVGTDQAGNPYYCTCWKPSYEDLKALNEGQGIFVKVIGRGLPPMILFTVNEEGIPNVE